MTERGKRKVRLGTVISDRMDRSVTVRIERLVQHPLYKKYIRKTKKLTAHDESNTCQVGDKIQVMETRPLSRRKHWRVVKIIERAK